VRKVERELPGEYVEAVETVLGSLSVGNLDDAVALAELPDIVRGYEDIKLANVERYRAALREALAAFT
jgi:indolepyruvate ferredoxin oxidoreductase